MRYPNLRYGDPNELQYYAMGIRPKELARQLRRSERSVKDWLAGKKKVPWWVPELLRLRQAEQSERHRQMGFRKLAPRLGFVSGTVIELAGRPAAIKPAAATGESIPNTESEFQSISTG